MVSATGRTVVLVGSGGSGKTTIAALLARRAAQDGVQVMVVDADPETSLAYRLGVPIDRADSLVPLAENSAYLQEKIEPRTDSAGKQTFTSPPDVNDVIERFSLPVGPHLRLVVLGNVVVPSSECDCAEHILLSAVMRMLVRSRFDLVIIDYGGYKYPEMFPSMISHGIVLARPTFDSLRIARHFTVQMLEQSVPFLYLVVNGICTERDMTRVKRYTTGLTCYRNVFSLPDDESIQETDPDVSTLLGKNSDLAAQIERLYHAITEISS